MPPELVLTMVLCRSFGPLNLTPCELPAFSYCEEASVDFPEDNWRFKIKIQHLPNLQKVLNIVNVCFVHTCI